MILKEQALKDVYVVVGRFQPLTIGHIKGSEFIYKKTGIPTVMAMIQTSKLDERHCFPSNIFIEYYKKILKNKKYILNFIQCKNANLVTLKSLLNEKGYNMKGIICGTDRYDSYKKMADKYMDEGFEVIEIQRNSEDISATKMREAIKKDDKKFVLKNTVGPKERIGSFLDFYYSELRKYYTVLNIIK